MHADLTGQQAIPPTDADKADDLTWLVHLDGSQDAIGSELRSTGWVTGVVMHPKPMLC